MRFTKRFAVALCLVLLMASAAFCIDPYKVNKGGFGPKIKGLQLGQKMSLPEIVSWGVAQGKLPFTLRLNRKEGNKLSIKFEGQGKDFKSFSVEQAEGRYAELKNFSGTLEDLLAAIEKIGFSEKTFFGRADIALDDDMRIKALNFSAKDFGVEGMTPKEFAQALINAYGIPSLDGVGRNKWQHRNLSQGWQVYIDWGNIWGDVFVRPIITQSAFN
ncbi:MAG: hypothetical protein IJ697_07530 [Synergistaceae bacterium]|nr:hypothetical protein [Synergistaceae bacterium]